MDNCPRTFVPGPCSTDHCPRTKIHGPLSLQHGPRTMFHGSWSARPLIHFRTYLRTVRGAEEVKRPPLPLHRPGAMAPAPHAATCLYIVKRGTYMTIRPFRTLHVIPYCFEVNHICPYGPHLKRLAGCSTCRWANGCARCTNPNFRAVGPRLKIARFE